MDDGCRGSCDSWFCKACTLSVCVDVRLSERLSKYIKPEEYGWLFKMLSLNFRVFCSIFKCVSKQSFKTRISWIDKCVNVVDIYTFHLKWQFAIEFHLDISSPAWLTLHTYIHLDLGEAEVTGTVCNNKSQADVGGCSCA